MNKRRIAIIIGMVVFLSLIYVVYVSLQQKRLEQHYQTVRNAFEQGDCQTTAREVGKARAISRWIYPDVIDKGAFNRGYECERFLEVVRKQEAGSFAEAFLDYETIIHTLQLPRSIFETLEEEERLKINERMITLILEQIRVVFSNVEPANLVSEDMCFRLDKFEKEKLIPRAEENLPKFYIACGELLNNSQQYSEAAKIYQLLLEKYPSYTLIGSEEENMARALLAEAEQINADNISQPKLVQTTGNDSNPVIIIQNDSYYEISLVLIGPKTEVKRIEPCQDCKITDSTRCTGEGSAVEQYELPNGTYEVVVKAMNSNVYPSKGKWTLNTGDVYYSCFYIYENQPLPIP